MNSGYLTIIKAILKDNDSYANAKEVKDIIVSRYAHDLDTVKLVKFIDVVINVANELEAE